MLAPRRRQRLDCRRRSVAPRRTKVPRPATKAETFGSIYLGAEKLDVQFVEEVGCVEIGDGGVWDVVADPVIQLGGADGVVAAGEVFL